MALVGPRMRLARRPNNPSASVTIPRCFLCTCYVEPKKTTKKPTPPKPTIPRPTTRRPITQKPTIKTTQAAPGSCKCCGLNLTILVSPAVLQNWFICVCRQNQSLTTTYFAFPHISHSTHALSKNTRIFLNLMFSSFRILPSLR